MAPDPEAAIIAQEMGAGGVCSLPQRRGKARTSRGTHGYGRLCLYAPAQFTPLADSPPRKKPLPSQSERVGL